MLLAKWQQFCLGLNEISLWNINSLSVYVYVILLTQFCLNILASALEGLPLKYKYHKYRKVSNIRRTLVGNKIVDHSDVVGASPAGAAPTTSSFLT